MSISDPRFEMPRVRGKKVAWTPEALDRLWRPHPDFVGPVEPPMVRVLREEGIARRVAAAEAQVEVERAEARADPRQLELFNVDRAAE